MIYAEDLFKYYKKYFPQVEGFIKSLAYNKTQSYPAFRDDFEQLMRGHLFLLCQSSIRLGLIKEYDDIKANIPALKKLLTKRSKNAYRDIFLGKKSIILNKAMSYMYFDFNYGKPESDFNQNTTNEKYVDIDQISSEGESYDDFIEFLQTLSDKDRLVASLKFFQKLSDQEIGDKIGRKRKTANNIVNKIKELYRKHVNETQLKKY